jgi:hypothetical protein
MLTYKHYDNVNKIEITSQKENKKKPLNRKGKKNIYINF